MLFRLFRAIPFATESERQAARQRITTDLFGRIISWGALSNPQIDLLKKRLIAIANSADLTAQMEDATAAEDGERRRLLHRIACDQAAGGLHNDYVKGLCRDLYDRSDWRELPIAQLRNLRDTVANRARRKTLPRRPAAAAPAAQPELPVNHFS